MKNKKLKGKPTTKITEADLAVFKLIINNQGKFILEKALYPRDKINLHFRKENSGLINALLRECNMSFEKLSDTIEQLIKKIA